ncbi:MAG: nucleoside deaminase [SAR324 cluster bacterium]|nr:nucleoside deaminase [SAR324 cluster bacterium]
MFESITISLPDWVPAFLANYPSHFPSIENRMKFVLALTRENIQAKTGGPFGAAVFETESGKLVSVGVNRVVPENLSSAHAEIVALSFAQKALAVYDLGGEGLKDHQLMVNAHMCAMCLGAVCWSGVKNVIYSASSRDVERITGFDEGPVPEDTQSILSSRGITLTGGILEKEGVDVLKMYVEEGGFIYNARRGN